MQITLHQSIQDQNEYKSDHEPDDKDISFAIMLNNQIPYLIKYGYQKKDLLILVRARRAIPAIQEILKREDIGKFSLSTMTYHNLAGRILHEYGFLRSQQRLTSIGRYEQLKMIKDICRSQNSYLNYKELLLFIAKCKSTNNLNRISFSSFLQSKTLIHKVIPFDNMNPDSEELKLSNNEIDKRASDVFHIYQDTLERNRMADYEDLISYSSQIMKRNPEVINFYRRQYKFTFMDNSRKYLIRKKNIKNFISILFLSNEKDLEFQTNSDQNENDFENSNIRFFTINSYSKIFQSNQESMQSPFPDSPFHENPDTSFSFENKIFSEVSDFDAEGENGFNLDVFSSGANEQKSENETEKFFQSDNEPAKVLSDFEEEEDGFLSDFDYDNEYESDDPYNNEESGMNYDSSCSSKNKFQLLNSIEKKKSFKNNFFSVGEPIIFDEIGNIRRGRRYSYYGQNVFLNEFNSQLRQFSNINRRAIFLSDDNYE